MNLKKILKMTPNFYYDLESSIDRRVGTEIKVDSMDDFNRLMVLCGENINNHYKLEGYLYIHYDLFYCLGYINLYEMESNIRQSKIVDIVG